MELDYKKLKVQQVGETEVEYWHAFREIVKVVYRNKSAQMEFPAEWLGWDRGWGHWLWVLLPAKLKDPQDVSHDVEALASQIHLALSLMNIRNVVSVERPSTPATTEERESTVKDFTEWMSERGWHVTLTKTSTLGRKLKLKRRGLSLFRPEPSPREIIEQGRWTARAFEALSQTEDKHIALYIAEGARHSNFLVSIEW
jgi:hypothetical protein